MEDSCPATPLILTGRESKSPLQVGLSSPESDGMKSPSRDSPDSRCVICLGRLQNKSFTDSCLHQFCFQCLLQWSKIKAECPLCKQPFKSIIHNVRSNVDYDQYHVEHGEPRYVLSDLMHSYNFDLIPVDRRFRYRSTMTREYFRELAESFLAHTRRLPDDSYQISPLVPVDPVSESNIRQSNRLRTNSLHQRPRQRGTSDFRRNVYAQDLWVQDLIDISGRFRECTPQFYRENPAQIHRIIPWLNREVNVLLSDCQSHAAYVLSRIISLLTVHPIRSREFREQVRPYFGGRTDHFIHELYAFAHSVYDIAGFDQNAIYGTNPNYATEVQEISSSEEDDSDIEVLETIKNEVQKLKKSQEGFKKMLIKRATSREAKSADEPVAGPSGISSMKTSESIDVCESDPEEVKVLDYVKPEPVVVTLSSGDEAPVFSDLDVSNGEYAEVIGGEVGASGSRDQVKKSRAGKGKCKSNGFGLKGRQKRKYIKSKRRRARSSSSSSSFFSVSSSVSSCDKATSSDSGHSCRKSTKKKSKSSRKKYKKKTSRRNVHGKRRKHDTDSDKKRKKTKKRKVKSYVIIPGRSLESLSSCGKHSRDSDEPRQHKHCRRKSGGESESPLSDSRRKRKRRDSLPEDLRLKKRSRERSSSSERDAMTGSESKITTTTTSPGSLNQPSTSALLFGSSSSSSSSYFSPVVRHSRSSSNSN